MYEGIVVSKYLKQLQFLQQIRYKNNKLEKQIAQETTYNKRRSRFKRSEARCSQMTLETLRSVAEKLQLDITGSKTDLIERITTHCPRKRNIQEGESIMQAQIQTDKPELNDTSVNMFLDDDQDLSDMMEEEIGVQPRGKKKKGKHVDLNSTRTSPSSSDTEIVERKKAHQTQVELSDIKNLITEIKELRKDMISPEERFERSRDQHEYNLLRSIGRDLDLGMNSTSTNEAVTYIETVRKKVKDQMIMLKVAKKYGWDVAVELLQSAEEELTNYTEIIDRARQAAATKKKSRPYDTSERKQFFRAPLYYNSESNYRRRDDYEQPRNYYSNRIIIQKTIITQDYMQKNGNQELTMKN
ncbi:11008_t:CDS:2 [Cetraspora pellucida]|uniref:11008_t:CDS:1 n=1 Tax=Cetraspora pellucida TaxID=1433469 RepID=A0ACA9KUE1_9GLOM|nr:11008_t:CDS:2 [Cetraspora pellucida]